MLFLIDYKISLFWLLGSNTDWFMAKMIQWLLYTSSIFLNTLIHKGLALLTEIKYGVYNYRIYTMGIKTS